jgi:predicted metal-dependent enzyme (double-stranded beta helix superfamily)
VNTYEEVEAEVHVLITPLLDEDKGLASLPARSFPEEETLLHISQESAWLSVPKSLISLTWNPTSISLLHNSYRSHHLCELSTIFLSIFHLDLIFCNQSDI